MRRFDYDLFVIGAGSGGVRAARAYAVQNKKVGIAEVARVGGTCVNLGCIPKKLMATAAHYSAEVRYAAAYGWQVGSGDFSWSLLRDRVSDEIARLNGVYAKLLLQQGVDYYTGHARLIDTNTVCINEQQVTAEKILIATGSRPSIPDVRGKEHIKTSDDFFVLPQLPKIAHIVGGGYIAVELASILVGLGVRVTLVYRGDLFLKEFDQDVREFVAQAFQRHQITLRFNSELIQIEHSVQHSNYRVHYQGGQQEQTDLVLYATGRVPHVDGLGLDAIGILLTSTGAIAVNSQFQTNIPSVYAIGDVIEGKALTPVAITQAMHLVRYWLTGEMPSLNLEHVPTAVFCDPPIASVGLTETQARQRYSEITVYRSTFRGLKHTITGSDEKTLMKVIVNKQNDQVVGLHMVGENAAEIMQGFAVAIGIGVTKAQLDRTVGIHPTAAEEFVTMK